MKKKRIAVSGGFDPVHVGHVRMIQAAAKFGDVIVICNSDAWLKRKKGYSFMPFKERMTIIQALKPVTLAVESVDEDDTVSKTLGWIRGLHKNEFTEMIFCNGGDRTYKGNTPEHDACLELGIEPVYGLGEKIQSSSWLINGK